MKKPFLTTLFASMLSVLLLSPANAAIISFDFSGLIVSSPDGIVPVSTGFSGNFSYDDGLSGSALSDSTRYSPVDFLLSIDGTDIGFTGIIVVNNDSTTVFPGSDIIQVGLYNITPFPVLNGFELYGIEIDLVDNSGTVLGDESLPLGYELSDWPYGGTLAFRSFATTNITIGSISTLTPAVPVPAAVWLFISGLLGLLGVARRKK